MSFYNKKYMNKIKDLEKYIKANTQLDWLAYDNDAYENEFFIHVDLRGKKLSKKSWDDVRRVFSMKNISSIYNTDCWHSDYGYGGGGVDEYDDLQIGFKDAEVNFNKYLIIVLFLEDLLLERLE